MLFCSHFSHTLTDRYKRVIPISLKYTFQQNLEQQLWLNTFYLVLEDLRNSEHKLSKYYNVILRIIDQVWEKPFDVCLLFIWMTNMVF